MRAWWAFRLGAALIAAAYAADQVVGQALKESLATFSSTWVMMLDVMARVAVVALGLALARLVFRGPRSRPAGLAMAILGFYFGLLPELSLPLTETTGTQIQPPFMFEMLIHSGGFATWAATAVMVLGIMELIRPTTAEAATSVEPPRLMDAGR